MAAQLPQIVRCTGQQPFAFAGGQAAPGHHGEFLAGLELPEDWFHGAGPQLVVFTSAGMSHPPDCAGGGRILLQVPGSLGRAPAWPGGVFGQRREQPQLAGVGAGEVLLADVPGVGQHGAQLGADAGLGQLLPAGVQQGVQQGAVDWVLGQHRAPTMTWFAVTTAWPLYPAT